MYCLHVGIVIMCVQDSGSSQDSAGMALLCEAYCCLGDAYLAEDKHPDRDCRAAAKAYAKALGKLIRTGLVPVHLCLFPSLGTLAFAGFRRRMGHSACFRTLRTAAFC